MNVSRIPRIALVALIAATLPSCVRSDETVMMHVGGHPFRVVLAVTPEEREKGLMFRETLGQDEGMLFVFSESAPRSFWMKNTSLPLSIAYVAANGRILEIYDMEPFSLTPVRSRYPARYALEVNQGRFEELGIEPGDRIEIERLPERLRR